MREAFKAGAIYFALVFTIGFALGAARLLVVAPRVGEMTAVFLELPLMLAASWFACGYVLRRRHLSQRHRRLVMGAVAFAMLMIAEAILSTLMGGTLAAHFASYRTAPGLLGLAGQLAFAAMPLARR
jgi:hypothetical protein